MSHTTGFRGERLVGIKTDFSGRSLVWSGHTAYDTLVERVKAIFFNPDRAKHLSTAEQIAEIVWEAATDGKDQVRYVAGEDAKATYAQRLAVGVESFRQGVGATFFGS